MIHEALPHATPIDVTHTRYLPIEGNLSISTYYISPHAKQLCYKATHTYTHTQHTLRLTHTHTQVLTSYSLEDNCILASATPSAILLQMVCVYMYVLHPISSLPEPSLRCWITTEKVVMSHLKLRRVREHLTGKEKHANQSCSTHSRDDMAECRGRRRVEGKPVNSLVKGVQVCSDNGLGSIVEQSNIRA